MHLHPPGRLLALLGNPNCGKTALFNALTGSRQKVANYAGVTVERKEGPLLSAAGRRLRLLDLPGTYSLQPRSPDERVTRDVLMGQAAGEKRPDLLLCVVDAGNLRRHLRLVLAARRQGLAAVLLLNMADLAEGKGLRIDAERLAEALQMPVLRTVAVRGDGLPALRELLDRPETWTPRALPQREGEDDGAFVDRLLRELGLDAALPAGWTERLDALALHPLLGPLLLLALLFLMFQAVFAGAELPMAGIESALGWLGEQLQSALPEGWLRSLLVDGLVAGVGGVLVFLPQILILFAFILLLEDSGYLPRAAYLLDRWMSGLGLSGRSFIPLLSSHACAIPGIMATRSIPDPAERRLALWLAPLMTCSARLPVYALLIAAFVPAQQLAGGLRLQGLVLFGLYVAGVACAALAAWVIGRGMRRKPQALMMELPDYHWPRPGALLIGLWQRALLFLRRVGGVILLMTLAMWVLASWPLPPTGSSDPALFHSLAGQLGRLIAPLFEPIGFNWQIAVALIPGMAAREVAVSSLATVYALDPSAEAQLGALLSTQWSAATGVALMAWFVIAPQCLSTLATLRRETGSWRMPLQLAAAYFALAYLAAGLCFQIISRWG